MEEGHEVGVIEPGTTRRAALKTVFILSDVMGSANDSVSYDVQNLFSRSRCLFNVLGTEYEELTQYNDQFSAHFPTF
jgi:hypothetical protein